MIVQWQHWIAGCSCFYRLIGKLEKVGEVQFSVGSETLLRGPFPLAPQGAATYCH